MSYNLFLIGHAARYALLHCDYSAAIWKKEAYALVVRGGVLCLALKSDIAFYLAGTILLIADRRKKLKPRTSGQYFAGIESAKVMIQRVLQLILGPMA